MDEPSVRYRLFDEKDTQNWDRLQKNEISLQFYPHDFDWPVNYAQAWRPPLLARKIMTFIFKGRWPFL